MKTKKTVREFIDESGVESIVESLKQQLMKDGKMPVYSDVIKEENGVLYQYVNYVQEGGGVLGVGLVGYTYVLERLGIRFLKLAGTSAGAINTMMLATVDKKNYVDTGEKLELKSEIVLHEMLNYNFWKLVDGNWFTRLLIRLFINSKIGTKILEWIVACSIIIPILYALFNVFILYVFTSLIFSSKIVQTGEILGRLTSIALVVLGITILLVIGFFILFRKNNFGINPGNNFYQWIKDILARNNIATASDLELAMAGNFEGLQLRRERLQSNDQGDTTKIEPPYLTIIASDITNQTKVEFPLMAKDYWKNPETVSPADFVRASMSIPVFFEPFVVHVSREVKERSTLQRVKIDVHRLMLDSYSVCFVDGGILSNFPINVFHNPKIKIARMPTFGVKLEDEDHIKPGENKTVRMKFLSFLGSIFNTVRFYYDRDFLKRNEIYEKGIAHVDVENFNWLDFGLDEKTKLELFKRGAEAAKTFFLGGTVWVDGKEKPFEPFNWEKFKEERTQMVMAQNG